DDDFGALAQLRFEGESAAVQLDQAFHDGQSEPGTLLRRFDRVRALSEGVYDDRYLAFGNPGAVVADAEILTAGRGPAHLQPDLPGLRRELDGIGQEIEADLAHRPLVGPQSRHVRLEQVVDRDAAVAGPQLEKVTAFLGDLRQHDGFLVEFVTPGL